ncbi:MAG: hypothetical protein AAB851_01840 [Patescibacteria group bacterium]
MKIYVLFGGSSFSNKDLGARYKSIVKILKSLGHSVIFDFVGGETAGKDKSAIKIKEADVVVGEVSRFDIAFGAKIVEALSAKKSTLCLYAKDKKPKGLNAFTGRAFQYLTVKEYDGKNLKSILADYADDLKKEEKLSEAKRFNFFLPQEMEEFLDWWQLKKKQPKSELVRDLIKEKIGEEKEYGLYL